MCARVDVFSETKLKVFFIMLKKLALDVYYANMSININVSMTFDETCDAIRNCFEDAKYKKSILLKWNNLTLKSVM
jgi:hypothetical protein